ncbi:HLA class II histocompatibility antigen, DM beta chain [Pelecanus crispus]|uniref:HLA class II histocompatibility antigen, DM beta chain n=1 Tax=Pelecanus crispus TaxID=36300 RepID=UPI003F5D4609
MEGWGQTDTDRDTRTDRGTPGDATYPRIPLVGAFLVHVASSCPLADNGSMLDFNFALVFNKNPLVCYDPDARRFVPCDWGLLHPYATNLSTLLNNDTTWVERAEARRQACRDLAPQFWAQTVLRRMPPQAHIIASKTGNARAPFLLTCHVWGFYPPEVTVIWLHNGDIVGPGDHPPISAIPNGDWTYQTQVTLMVAPMAGDTFTCSVQHASLDQPLLEDWSPGLSLGLSLKVAAATVVMALGLSFFIAGTYRYWARPPAPGYTPLPGDNYPAGSI